MTRPLGIGLVGAGRFGAFCVDAFRDLPGGRVVAVMDSDTERAAAVAPTGATVHGEYESLLSNPAVDIVHIGTPPFLHGPMARRAAERGKHVFVEKPLATSLEDARDAIDAAVDAGVQLSIDYVLRHHPLHRLAIELTRSGVLGDLQLFALENFASSENLPADHWFWDRTKSGGIHVEHGVHFFDLCLALMVREPDSVSGTAQRRADGRTDRVGALLSFGEVATATFFHAFNRTSATERTTIRLAFEHGHVLIDGWIPTSLELDGAVPAASVEAVRASLRTGACIVEPALAGDAGGATTRIKARVEAPDRQGEYRLAVRSGMLDLMAAIDGARPLQVTAADGVRSLAAAIRATP